MYMKKEDSYVFSNLSLSKLDKTGSIYVHLCIHTDSPRLHIGVKVLAPLNLGNLRTLMLLHFESFYWIQPCTHKLHYPYFMMQDKRFQ